VINDLRKMGLNYGCYEALLYLDGWVIGVSKHDVSSIHVIQNLIRRQCDGSEHVRIWKGNM
jgi:hypothetical protein